MCVTKNSLREHFSNMFCFKKNRGSYTPVHLPNERQSRRRRKVVQPTNKLRHSQENILQASPKTEEQKAAIRKAIEKNEFLFKILNGRCLEECINAVYEKNVSADEIIIKEGEKGDNMYISETGAFQVLIKDKVLETFEEGKVFGELAILYNDVRLATVKALTEGKVWVLEQRVFDHLTQVTDEEEQKERVEFLQRVKNLNKANKDVLQEVATLLKKVYFEPNKLIFRQGDKGDKFYIITAGQVIISKEGKGVVGRVGKGKYFGELALLGEDARTATVEADDQGVECLTLTRHEFLNFFGDVKDFAELSIAREKVVALKPLENKYQDTNLSDLKIIANLGEGAFGKVALVKHKKDKKLMALKYIKKHKIRSEQQRYIFSEKEIQLSLDSPFIIRLYKTFKNSRYLYFLIEAGLGGDLFSLLNSRPDNRFTEKEAQFITACVVEAFTCLHVRNIIYRDLKPENLLIDEKGYIKLADFGISKILEPGQKKTFSFVGSPEYIAPEIIRKSGHNISADYWTLGIFIHEMLTGRTPFKDNNSRYMYQKILTGIDYVRFPSLVTKHAKDLIIKLCKSEPEYRLGMQKNGIEDIKNHKWFKTMDWRKLRELQIKSPIEPTIKDEKDLKSESSLRITKDKEPPEETSGWDKDF